MQEEFNENEIINFLIFCLMISAGLMIMILVNYFTYRVVNIVSKEITCEYISEQIYRISKRDYIKYSYACNNNEIITLKDLYLKNSKIIFNKSYRLSETFWQPVKPEEPEYTFIKYIDKK